MRRIRAALCALAVLASGAAAAYPEHQVRVVVPYVAGGPTDTSARMIAVELSKRMGQSFYIDNRAGAAGNIGAEFVAKSRPDGYTLLVIGAAHAINKTLYHTLNYDVQRDFTMIATFSTAPMILLANPAAGFNNVKDFVARAKAHPGTLNYCSAGIGTAPHLAMEAFKQRAGISVNHVPYKGSADGINDLIAGRVQLCFDSVLVWRQWKPSGMLKALAVTGSQRSPVAPDVASMAEAGYPKFDLGVWYGIAAPAHTPPAIVNALNQQINAILADPGIQQRLRELGAVPLVKSPAEFTSFMNSEVATWGKVVNASGAKVD